MDDVTSPENANQPAGAQPTAPSTDGGTQQPATPAGVTPEGGQPAGAATRDWETENANLKKALQQERERNRQRAQQQPGSQGQEVDESLLNNPEYQRVYLENATNKLRDGVRQLIENFPNLPKSVANAITRNPRGFVREGTNTIEMGLYDIEDYINEVLDAEQAGQPTPQPKTVQVAQNNAGGSADVDEEAELQAISEIPVEEWTKEQEAKVEAHMARLRAKKK